MAFGMLQLKLLFMYVKCFSQEQTKMVSSEYPYRSNNQKCRRETKLIEEK